VKPTDFDDYRDYYKHKLETGLEWQDFVTRLLYRHGLPLVTHASKKMQIQYGENLAGIEIKHDEEAQRTGNLYIETDEKSHPDRPSYTRSGIYRTDGSWLYAIGSRDIGLFIFGMRTLQRMEQHRVAGSFRFRRVCTPTSKGFLVPLEDARAIAERFLEATERAA